MSKFSTEFMAAAVRKPQFYFFLDFSKSKTQKLISITVVSYGGNCNKSLSTKLQKQQNRTACILTSSSYDANADDDLFV